MSSLLYNTSSSFGTNKIVNSNLSGSNNFFQVLAVESNGKILAGGKKNGDPYLVRYSSTGELETTFDTSALNFGSNDVIVSIVINSDGKIIVAGNTPNSTNPGNTNTGRGFLAKYNTNGTLDTSFNSVGYVRYPTTFPFFKIVIQIDGKILVGGKYPTGKETSAVLRYNTDGTLDSTFGTGGKADIYFSGGWDGITDLTLQPDGKIVVVMAVEISGNWKGSIARLNTNGSLDTTFNGNGKYALTFTGYYMTVFIQPDNKIVACGTYQGSGNTAGGDFFISRFNNNGTLDNSFGTNGIKYTDLDNSYDELFLFKYVQVNGVYKLNTYGFSRKSGTDKIGIVVYDTNGTVETKYTIDTGISGAVFKDIELLPNNNIIATFTTTSTSPTITTITNNTAPPSGSSVVSGQSSFPDTGSSSLGINGVVWNNNTLNNKPSFYFSNNNSSINNFFSGNLNITGNELTIMTVSKLTNTSDDNAFLLALYGPDDNQVTQYLEYYGPQISIKRFTADGVGNGLVAWSQGVTINTANYTHTNPRLHSFWRTSTNLFGTDSPGVDDTSATGNGSRNLNITNYTIGTRPNLASNTQLNGYISEIIIFNRVLSLSNRQKMEGYLSWKWGLQSELPVNHPYYSVNPVSTTSPTQIPGNILWLDATDPYNNGFEPINSSYVTSWVDKSANANFVTPICFPKGTPILTDQGEVEIQNINTEINTINNKKIVAITKSVLSEKHIICIEKHSLATNIPLKDTYISMNHEVLYNNKMVKAKNLVGFVEGIYKVSYDKEILYNVLLEKHSIMSVNNMIVETLNPENIVAKIYNSGFSIKEKERLTIELNNAVKNYNVEDYNKLNKYLSK